MLGGEGLHVPDHAAGDFLGGSRGEVAQGDLEAGRGVELAAAVEGFGDAVGVKEEGIAGLELFLPLTTGAAVVIATRETVTDGRLLREELHRSGATVMNGSNTPSSFASRIASPKVDVSRSKNSWGIMVFADTWMG